MTIDITPEAVERLINMRGFREVYAIDDTLRALSAALTASQAETAAWVGTHCKPLTPADHAYITAHLSYELEPVGMPPSWNQLAMEIVRLSTALTASQAETAAAYEAAASDTVVANVWANYGSLGAAKNVIRALTTAHSKAALARMIADARADGMREALDAASDYTQRVYGEDWKFLSNPIDRERILAAIPKGTSHE